MYGNYIQFNLNVHRHKKRDEMEKGKEKYTQKMLMLYTFIQHPFKSLCTSSFSSSTTVNMSFDDDADAE